MRDATLAELALLSTASPLMNNGITAGAERGTEEGAQQQREAQHECGWLVTSSKRF